VRCSSAGFRLVDRPGVGLSVIWNADPTYPEGPGLGELKKLLDELQPTEVAARQALADAITEKLGHRWPDAGDYRQVLRRSVSPGWTRLDQSPGPQLPATVAPDHRTATRSSRPGPATIPAADSDGRQLGGLRDLASRHRNRNPPPEAQADVSQDPPPF
jgi:hypothetical protein